MEAIQKKLMFNIILASGMSESTTYHKVKENYFIDQKILLNQKLSALNNFQFVKSKVSQYNPLYKYFSLLFCYFCRHLLLVPGTSHEGMEKLKHFLYILTKH